MTINPSNPPITGTTVVGTGGVSLLSDATSGGVWSSSNPAIAMVGSLSGSVSGVSVGTCTITYTLGACYVTSPFTVTINPITGYSNTCVGTSTLLSSTTPGGTWSSSNPAIASVSSGGLVTGMAAGAATITYTVGGSYVTYAFSVLSAGSISGPTMVCVGSPIILTISTPGGTWSSGNMAVATVGSTGTVTGTGAGVVAISYSIGGCTVYHMVTVNAVPVITGSSSVCIGSPLLLSATPLGGTWTSSNVSIATVGLTGTVTGVSTGVANIYYTMGCYSFQSVTVNLTPAAITGPSIVSAGFTIALSDATPGGTWSSSNPAVGSVDPVSGVVAGIAGGICNISYSLGSCFVFQTITVNALPPITGTTTICQGSTSTLSDATPLGNWSSSNPAIGSVDPVTGVVAGIAGGTIVVTYTVGIDYITTPFTVIGTPVISGPLTVCPGSMITLTGSPSGGTWSGGAMGIASVGLTGVVTGLGAGSATVYYTYLGCVQSVDVTVNPIPSILGSAPVCVCASVALTGSIPGGTWSSSNPAVGSVDISGNVTGVSGGVVNITYTLAGCYSYTTIIVSSLPVISGFTSVCVGLTVTLTATPAGGTWSGGTFGIASVSPTGVVTGMGIGSANVTYTVPGGCFTYQTMSVTAPVISGSSTVCTGSTTSLSGSPLGGTWTSGSPGLATVSSSGVVTGIAPGVVNIYYTAGCYSYQSVTVNPTPASITGTTTVSVGGSSTLSSATPGGTWSSSNPAIGSVDPVSGTVTGISNGSINITYTVGGCYVYIYFSVSTILPITGSPSTCVGTATLLSDGTPCGTWSSSNPAIATVSIGGSVMGVAAGSVNITYTVGMFFVTMPFTVVAPPVITGSTSACAGSVISLSATPSGGTWSSSNMLIATVNPSGDVTGISGGAVNITYSVSTCYVYQAVTIIALPVITGSSTVCAGSTITLSATPLGGSWTSGNPGLATVSPTGDVNALSPGVVNIYYTAGCYNFQSVTVNPTPAALTGPSSVSVGASITLSSTTPGGTWSTSNPARGTVDGSGVVTGIAGGSFHITYTVGGCYVVKFISVPPGMFGPGVIGGHVSYMSSTGPLPAAYVVISLLSSDMHNTLATTNTDIAGNYTFSSLPNDGYIVYPEVDGYATTPSALVSISAAAEVCNGINFVKYPNSLIVTPGNLAVNEISKNTGVSIYPNPTKNKLNIAWENQSANEANVIVTDVTGREVFHTSLIFTGTSGQSQVNLGDLKSGIYFITVKSENLNYSSKLVINN